MKKTIFSILSLALVCAFMFFAVASSSDDPKTSDQGKDNASGEEQVSDNTAIGKYSVEIKECRLAKNYENKDAIIVKYNFTNVSDDNSASFDMSFIDTAYQDGVEIEHAYSMADSAEYNGDNQSKKIKKGSSLEVEVAYLLNDTTTDVEVEVKEFIGLDDVTIKKTFTIAK